MTRALQSLFLNFLKILGRENVFGKIVKIFPFRENILKINNISFYWNYLLVQLHAQISYYEFWSQLENVVFQKENCHEFYYRKIFSTPPMLRTWNYINPINQRSPDILGSQHHQCLGNFFSGPRPKEMPNSSIYLLAWSNNFISTCILKLSSHLKKYYT